VPNVFIQYWSMRLMAYSAGVVFLLALWGLWLIRRKTLGSARWFLVIATWAVILPFVMNTTGWLLTESGRQPWIVQGLMLTKNGISPSVGTTDIVISLVVFVLLYLALAIVDLLLMLRFARKELAPEPAGGDGADAPVPALRY
jgi:cytochrome d ubiquinol oxidase subunit I